MIFHDKNIAVVEGFSITAELEKNYPDINTVPVKTIREGLVMVSTGELDGFVESIGVVSYYLDTDFIPNLRISSDVQLDKMDYPALHMAVHKKNSVLRGILQKGLESVSAAEMNDLRNKWISYRYH